MNILERIKEKKNNYIELKKQLWTRLNKVRTELARTTQDLVLLGFKESNSPFTEEELNEAINYLKEALEQPIVENTYEILLNYTISSGYEHFVNNKSSYRFYYKDKVCLIERIRDDKSLKHFLNLINDSNVNTYINNEVYPYFHPKASFNKTYNELGYKYYHTKIDSIQGGYKFKYVENFKDDKSIWFQYNYKLNLYEHISDGVYDFIDKDLPFKNNSYFYDEESSRFFEISSKDLLSFTSDLVNNKKNLEKYLSFVINNENREVSSEPEQLSLFDL